MQHEPAQTDGDRRLRSFAAARDLSIEGAMERLYARAGARYIETLTALIVGAILLFVIIFLPRGLVTVAQLRRTRRLQKIGAADVA